MFDPHMISSPDAARMASSSATLSIHLAKQGYELFDGCLRIRFPLHGEIESHFQFQQNTIFQCIWAGKARLMFAQDRRCNIVTTSAPTERTFKLLVLQL